MTVDATMRAALKQQAVTLLFSGLPPESSGIRPVVAALVAEQGQTVHSAGLGSFVRQLELELPSLSGSVARTAGSLGLQGAGLNTARQAVSTVMAARGLGQGPAAWALWLDKDAAQAVGGSIVSGVLSGGTASSAATQALASLSGWRLNTATQAPSLLPAGFSLPAAEASGRLGTGSFGTVTFEASADVQRTWRDVAREHKAKYAAHEVLGSAPRLEFLARELSTCTFRVRLDASLGVNPAEELEKLKALSHAGRAERMVLGGRNLGLHVLESVKETWRHTVSNGAVLVAEVELSLKEYV